MEFTCSNGYCLNLEERCDGKVDCQDASDEKDCKAFITFPGYNQFLVPPAVGNDSSLTMKVSVNIDDIITIDENNGDFKTKITFVRKWVNTQLTYQNLKRNMENNKISKEDREKMWIPWTNFKNVKRSKDIELTDEGKSVKIIPHPDYLFELGDRTNVRKTKFFKGTENIILYEGQFTVNWMCFFDMRWYPFDTQECQMEMFSPDSSVTLYPIFAKYSGPVNLPQHFVRGVDICQVVIKGNSGIIVEVFLGRPLFGIILSVFMPTSILLVLSQMVRVFGRDHLEMVIEVNLTLLLVLATL